MDKAGPNGERKHGFGESLNAARRTINEAKVTFWHAIAGVQYWVERRGRLTQLGIGGIVAIAIRHVWILSSRWISMVVELLLTPPIPSTRQLLLGVIGAIVGQTAMQTQILKTEEFRLSSMADHSDTRPDGGKEFAQSDQKERAEHVETSGGGAIGGAIIGAAFGASYGPSGMAGGAVFGAFAGNVFEQGLLSN